MKILQIVTYISPEGAYGGPVRVAINQAKALSNRGHFVQISAAAGGYGNTLPSQYDDYPVNLYRAYRLIPNSGFAGLISPKLICSLFDQIRDADIVHVHMARDMVSLPSALVALLFNKPLIVQTHGMIDKSSKKLSVPLDAFLTKPILRRASKILTLTAQEEQDLLHIDTKLRLERLTNGVQLPQDESIELKEGPQESPTVLYLARLHSRKRPLMFVRAAAILQRKFNNAKFKLVGPDEGEGPAVLAEINKHGGLSNITWDGAAEPHETSKYMRNASVYALPSINEPFPMTVLEAMSFGVPVVISESCGLAKIVAEAQCGIVCRDSGKDFEEALSFLLTNKKDRLQMGANARRWAARNMSIENVAQELERNYQECLKN